ncbi:hypothetical protein D3C81_1793730 [compost metagenome]
MPPIGLGVGVPGVPHHVPARVSGGGHLQDLDEGKGLRQPLQAGDGLGVIGVGNGHDPIPAARIVELGQGGEGCLHRPLKLAQDRVEQNNKGQFGLGRGQGVVHVHAVHFERAEIHLQHEAAQVENLGYGEQPHEKGWKAAVVGLHRMSRPEYPC